MSGYGIPQIFRSLQSAANLDAWRQTWCLCSPSLKSKSERSDDSGVSKERCALGATRPRGPLSAWQVDRCSVRGGREDARGQKELLKIFVNSMNQGILRGRKGGEEPQQRIAHGWASGHASEFLACRLISGGRAANAWWEAKPAKLVARYEKREKN